MVVLIVTEDPLIAARIERAMVAAGRDSQAASSLSELPPGPPAPIVITAGLDCAAVATVSATLRAAADWADTLLLAITPAGVSREALFAAGAEDCLPADFADAELLFRLSVFERCLATRRADAAASQRMALLAAIVESTSDAVVARDREQKIIVWNAAAEALYGYTAAEAMGRGPDLLARTPEALATAAPFYPRVYAGESIRTESLRIRKDGTEVLVSASAFPIVGADGEVLAAAGVSRDITAQKRIAEETALLAAIVQSSPHAIITRDLEGRVVTWNPAAERLYGYTAEEAIGSLHELIADPEDSDIRKGFKRLQEGERDFSRQFRRRTKSGTIIDVDSTMFSVFDAAGALAGSAGITRDITAEKRAAAELEGRIGQQLALSNLRAGLATATSEQAIFELTIEAVAQAFGTERASFRLLDPSILGGRRFVAARGLGHDFLRAVTAAEGMAPPPEAVAPYILSISSEEVPARSKVILDEEGIVSVLAVPVLVDGQPLGFAGAYFGEERSFLPYEMEFAETAAAQAGLAIERLRTQAAFRESEAMLALVFDAADVGVVVLDEDGRFVRVNRAHNRIFGYDDGELLGQRFSVHLPAAGRRLGDEHFRAILRGELSFKPRDWDVLRKDGTPIVVSTTASRFERDGHAYSVTTVTDVTDQRAAARVSERLGRVLGNSPSEILLFDAQTLLIVDANPAAVEHLGYTIEELHTMRRRDILIGATDENFREIARPLWTGEAEQIRFEGIRPRKDGTTYPVEVRLFLSNTEREPVFVAIAEDVTERKAAEAALGVAERYLQEIIESSPVVLFALDPEGVYTYSSAAGTSRLGDVPSPEVGLSILDLRRDNPGITAAVRRALAGESFTYVIELGGITWETHYSVSRDEAGEITGVTGVATDITTRMQAEAAVRQSEANLRAIFESSMDGVVLSQGSDSGEVPGGVRDVFVARVARCVAGESFTVESEFTLSDGSLLSFELTYNPVELDPGNVTGVVIVSRDVTEKKRQEAAIRQSEANLRAIFESSDDGIALLDTAACVLAFNSAADRRHQKTFGVPLLAGSLLADLLPTSAQMVHAERFARCLAGEAFTVESNGVDRAGKQVFWELGYHPVRMGAGEVSGVVIVNRDVTERKRMDEALLQAQKLESLGVLAGGIAHDFNNLLVGILGNAGLALAEIPPVSPARETLLDIETAGKRAADLARQMLAYSGKGRFVVQHIDLNALVEELSLLLRSSIGKGVRVAYNFSPTPLLIEADATQIRQVVMNLVINASDAIGGGEGTVSISTGHLHATTAELAEAWLALDLPEGDYVYLDISDTGSGMDAETLKRIFDPFFTTKFTGRGLGLAAVSGIVRGHHGALKVTSKPGEGTTFRLLLPRLAAAEPVPEPTVTPAAAWRGSGVVLIADDDLAVRRVTARALTIFGFEPVEAGDGQEAVEYVAAHGEEIVCVLLDMTMPRLNGAQAAEQIARLRPGLPVVILSGYSELEVAEGFDRSLVAAFVQKPFELPALREILRNLLSPRS